MLSNNPITAKELKLLEQILFEEEERGKREDFEKEFGQEPLGAFNRCIIGLDVKSALNSSSESLQTRNICADQLCRQNIIKYLTKNVTIEPSMLFELPFTDMNTQSLIGTFDDSFAHKVISIIERINENTTA